MDGVDVLGRSAVLAFGLHDHVELLGVALVACHGASAQHGLDGARHHIHAHTQVGSPLAVDGDAQLGLVQAQVHIGRLDAGIPGDGVEHAGRRGAQLFVAVRGLDHVVERPRTKALPQRRRGDRKGIHPRQIGDARLHLARQLQRAALAVFPVHGAVDHAALRHGGIADAGKDAVELGVVAADFLQLQRIAVGVFERRAIGRVDAGQDGAAVLQGRELLAHLRIHQRHPGATEHHHPQHQPARLEHRSAPATAPPAGRDQPAQQATIGLRQAGEPALHETVKPVRIGVVPEQQRAHHGRERERHKTRHHHRARQRQRKLDKQPPGAPGGKGQRGIHRHQGQCHGHNGKADFPRSLDGR